MIIRRRRRRRQEGVGWRRRRWLRRLRERRRPLAAKATTTKTKTKTLLPAVKCTSAAAATAAHSTHSSRTPATECFVCTCSLPTLSERRIRATTPAFFPRTDKNFNGPDHRRISDLDKSIFLVFVWLTCKGSAHLLSRHVAGARRQVPGDLRGAAHRPEPLHPMPMPMPMPMVTNGDRSL